MALIKCPECDKEISDKVSICPYCGIQIKQKKKTTRIMLIAMLIFACLVIFMFFFNTYKKISYPNVVGSISLNMKQEEVEKILLEETQRELYYLNWNSESEGAGIFVTDSIEGNSLSNMSFSKGHPNIIGIYFYFDAENKLCQISILTSDTSFQSVCNEYCIDINDIKYFYGGAWTKGYTVDENMYTQVSVIEDTSSKIRTIIEYKRISDAENITDLQK